MYGEGGDQKRDESKTEGAFKQYKKGNRDFKPTAASEEVCVQDNE